MRFDVNADLVLTVASDLLLQSTGAGYCATICVNEVKGHAESYKFASSSLAISRRNCARTVITLTMQLIR